MLVLSYSVSKNGTVSDKLFYTTPCYGTVIWYCFKYFKKYINIKYNIKENLS